MGVVDNIAFDKFPAQSTGVGKKVTVCFNYDTEKTIQGEILRDDVEHPLITIILLKDGRHVLATECRYTFKKLP